MKKFPRFRGTALLLALLVMMAATFVLAGWAMLLAQRVAYSDDFVTGQKRRLATLNAENLGKQWARSALSSNAVPTVSIALSNDWGQFTAATAASNVLNTSLVANTLNHYGPVGIGGFALPISATLSGSGFTNARIYLLRSRSPVLGGFPLVAQTNTVTGAAVAFTGVQVATNSPALVYAAPGSTATAPAAITYLARTNRNVVLPGSSTQSPPSPYPFVPLASAPSGSNAFNGLLTTNLSRTFTINNLDAAIDTAFPVTPTVSNPLRSPNGSPGTFRIIGTAPGNRQIFEPSFSRTPSMLVVGPAPNSAPEQVDAETIRFFYFGQTYEVRFVASGIQYRKGTGSWKPSTPINPLTKYVLIKMSDKKISKKSIKDPIVMTDTGGGGEDRVILFAPLDGSLVAVRANEISFSTPAGPFATAIPAAVAYRSATFAESALLLLGLPTDPTAYNAQTAMNPQNFQLRALVDGQPLLQLDHTVAHDFRDPNGVPVLAYAGNQAERLVLKAQAGTASPVLAHVRQDTLAGSTWRKVLLVFGAQNTLNLQSSDGALIFSYLETGPLGISLEDANNSRPLALSVSGSPGVAAHATRLVGGSDRTWNLTATFNNSPAEFQPGGNPALTWIGGIRANGNVTVTPSTSSLILERNTTPGDLDLFVDRMGWVESWNQ